MSRTLRCLVATALAGAAIAAAVPSGASAQESTVAEPVAILDPFLKTLIAGAPVGAGLACQAATGAITAGAGGFGTDAAALAAALTEQISLACAEFSAQNSAALQALQAQTSPLAVINPAVNPGIELFASSIRESGEGMGDLLFGRTITQVADLIAYYGVAPASG